MQNTLVVIQKNDAQPKVLFNESSSSGEYMFYRQDALQAFSGNYPNLTNGNYMFNWSRGLTDFSAVVPNLTTAYAMFFNCTFLSSSINQNFNYLEDGTEMFSYTNISYFNGKLPNLVYGLQMFYDCSKLETFVSLNSMSKLKSGYMMFSGCTKLKQFAALLRSLEDGTRMFSGAQLNDTSVQIVITYLPTYSDGKTHRLHLGKSTNFVKSSTAATLLGTTVPIADGTYNVKGWEIIVG